MRSSAVWISAERICWRTWASPWQAGLLNFHSIPWVNIPMHWSLGLNVWQTWTVRCAYSSVWSRRWLSMTMRMRLPSLHLIWMYVRWTWKEVWHRERIPLSMISRTMLSLPELPTRRPKGLPVALVTFVLRACRNIRIQKAGQARCCGRIPHRVPTVQVSWIWISLRERARITVWCGVKSWLHQAITRTGLFSVVIRSR